MPSEKLVLRFPPRTVRDPIVYRLVKDYDLKVVILRASISPDEAGHMVLELDGNRAQIESAHEYLESQAVTWQLLSADVRWREDRCVHCTACISVCPSGALILDRGAMTVSFDNEKCIGCGLCIPVCGYKAMEISV